MQLFSVPLVVIASLLWAFTIASPNGRYPTNTQLFERLLSSVERQQLYNQGSLPFDDNYLLMLQSADHTIEQSAHRLPLWQAMIIMLPRKISGRLLVHIKQHPRVLHIPFPSSSGGNAWTDLLPLAFIREIRNDNAELGRALRENPVVDVKQLSLTITDLLNDQEEQLALSQPSFDRDMHVTDDVKYLRKLLDQMKTKDNWRLSSDEYLHLMRINKRAMDKNQLLEWQVVLTELDPVVIPAFLELISSHKSYHTRPFNRQSSGKPIESILPHGFIRDLETFIEQMKHYMPQAYIDNYRDLLDYLSNAKVPSFE